MIKLEIFDGTKTYMYPNGQLAEPEIIIRDFPAIAVFPHVITTDSRGQMCYAVENLSAMEDRYDIDPLLTDEESILLIQEIINTPQIVSTEPTADERIASALEFQNLMLL